LEQQELTPEGRFPCRFSGCDKSFKYNGKSRKAHEASHNPPVTIEEPELSVSPCRPSCPPEESKELDDAYNYNCALLADCYLFFNFLDAIKEGDGVRIMRQYKYFMLFCKADGCYSTKYSIECLYQFFLTFGVLSQRDSERFIWNRSINNHGKKGCNIPLDESTEHSNNFVKQAIKNLGPNITEAAVARICKSESTTRSILDKLDESISRHKRGGSHSNPSSATDLQKLVKQAFDFGIFNEQEGRKYHHFRNFTLDRLNDLDATDLYSWISKHKKNVALGIKAR
jgi:L1 cell adhesion molecule like protein